jgi:hypothetical protein
MSPENTRKIIENFPKIFPNSKFEFECRDGWFQLIYSLCEKMQRYIDSFPGVEQVSALQIKEKFGGLRFYTKNADKHLMIFIMDAEYASSKTCEKCGNIGEIIKEGYLLGCRCRLCRKDNT